MNAALQVDHHAVDAGQSPNAQSGTIVRALVTISGTALSSEARAPLSLSFVIDRSGSMSGPRLDAARVAVAHALERLHPDDVVSVVAFDDVVETVAAPDRRARQPLLVTQVQNIDARGCTNLSGGWLRGREHMQYAQGVSGAADRASRRILLVTDGHANQGITDPATLIELARTARNMGITTSTIGIGEGYDDALLRSMADAGGGNAWYIERPDQSKDVLGEELGNLLSVAAQGLTVTLTLHEAVSVFMTHSDWPVATPSAHTYCFDLGDLYAAEPKPLLVELFVPAHRLEELAAAAHPLATMTISADVVTAAGSVEHRVMHLPMASTMEGQQSLVPDIEHAVLLANTAKAREHAARLQREGNAAAAEMVMREARNSVLESAVASDIKYSHRINYEADDLAQLADQYQQGTYTELDAKYQMQRSYNARRGKAQYNESLRRKRPDA
ncbi:vWA domain-containing protein [Gemmatimonas phototrophica]|uniref:vWA domain-containing protein n=1 Tax=Gemmatimonas phototrophica TaxID=1379270 RepID=UPI0006A6D611|nr:VWA domain-containing protein [Gemmatimonas phototrophica]